MTMEWRITTILYYFWTVAKEGTIARACEKLRLAQPTISGQLRQFEETLEKSCSQSRLCIANAEEIFSVGQELQDVLRGRPPGFPSVGRVCI